MVKQNDNITVDNLGETILTSKYFEKQDDPKMNEEKKKMKESPDDTSSLTGHGSQKRANSTSGF